MPIRFKSAQEWLKINLIDFFRSLFGEVWMTQCAAFHLVFQQKIRSTGEILCNRCATTRAHHEKFSQRSRDCNCHSSLLHSLSVIGQSIVSTDEHRVLRNLRCRIYRNLFAIQNVHRIEFQLRYDTCEWVFFKEHLGSDWLRAFNVKYH